VLVFDGGRSCALLGNVRRVVEAHAVHDRVVHLEGERVLDAGVDLHLNDVATVDVVVVACEVCG
jgi:hypothetical protein